MTKIHYKNTHVDQSIRHTLSAHELGNQSCYRSFVAMLLLAAGNMTFVTTQVNAAQPPGKVLYERNCAVCHGVDGEGAMPGVKDLVANASWMSKTDTELTSIIVNGVQGADSPVVMPPRAGNPDLTNDQIMSIVTYLRNLAGGN